MSEQELVVRESTRGVDHDGQIPEPAVVTSIQRSSNKVMMSVPNPKRSVPVSFLSLPDEDSYSPFLDEVVEPVPNSTRDTKGSSELGLRPTSAATPEIFEFFNDVQQPEASSLSVRSNGSISVGDQSGASRGVIGSARKCKSSNSNTSSNGPNEGDAILGSWATGLPGGFLSSASTPIGSGVVRASSASPKPNHLSADRGNLGLLHAGSDLADAPWEHSRSHSNVQHMPICRPSSTPAYPSSITSLFRGADFELGLQGTNGSGGGSGDLSAQTDALNDLLRDTGGSELGVAGSGAASTWWNGQASQSQQQQQLLQQQTAGQNLLPSVRGRDRDYSFGSLLGLSSSTAGMGLSSSDHRRVPFGSDSDSNTNAAASLAEDLLADRPARGSFFDLHAGTQTRRENLRAGLALGGGTVSAPPQFLTGLYAADGFGSAGPLSHGLSHNSSSNVPARPLSINTYASAIGGQGHAAASLHQHSPSPIGSRALSGSPHPAIGSRTHSPVPQTGLGLGYPVSASAAHSPLPQLGLGSRQHSPVPGQLVTDAAGGAMDDSSVEGAVLRSCREILAGAADHSLKAVELANTLRARGSLSFHFFYLSCFTT